MLHKLFSFSSLRLRLLTLVFLSVLPVLGIFIYNAREQYERDTVALEQEAKRLTKVAASTQDQLVEKTRELLVSLSQVPQIQTRDKATCSKFLTDLKTQTLPEIILGVADIDGQIFCSNFSLQKNLNIKDKDWFKKTVENNYFSLGSYEINQITGKPMLMFGYPLRDNQEKVEAVLFYGLDLKHINEIISKIELPTESSLIITDRQGIILSHSPQSENWIGKSWPEISLIKNSFDRSKGEIQILNLNHLDHLYTVTTLISVETEKIYVIFDIPKTTAFAKINKLLWQYLLQILLIILIMILVAWFGSNIFILRQISTLLRATKQLATGDLTSRTGLADKPGELHQLAKTFDQMAETLQKRQDELNRMNRALRAISNCNQVLIRATEESDLLNNICEIIVNIGGYSLAWVGFVQENEEKSVRVMAQAGYEDGYLEFVNITYSNTERGQGPTGQAIRNGKPYIAKNILTDTNYEPWRNEAIKRGYASSISLPLLDKNQAFGAINIYASQPDVFDEQEVKLLEELAADLVYGIKALRTNIERKQAEIALRNSEELYRTLACNFPNGWVCLFDRNLRYTLAEGKELNVIGLAKELLEGKTIWEVFTKETCQIIEPYYRSALVGEVNNLEMPYIDRIYSMQIFPVKNDQGEIFTGMVVAQDITDRIQTEAKLKQLNEELEIRVEERNAELINALDRIQSEFSVRIEAEAALRENAMRFRAIFNQSFQFIALLQPNGEVLEVNETALAIAALTHADVIHRPLWHPVWQQSAQVEQLWQQVIFAAAQDQFIRFEIETNLGNSKQLTIDFAVKPVKDETGKVMLIIAEGRDISDRKQAEAKLRESEERFKTAFEYAPIGIALVSPTGRWLQINYSLCEIIGYSEEELLNTTFQAITHPDDLEIDLNYVHQMLNGTINYYQMEKRYFHKNKHIVWVLLTVSLVRDLAGNPLYFISQIQDITQRKQIEISLSQLAAIVQSSDDAIISKNLEGIILTWNSGAEKIYGYSAEEIVGRHISIIIPKIYTSELSEIIYQISQGKSIDAYETVRLRKDGQRIMISTTFSPIKDNTGKIIGVSSIARDITDRKRVELAMENLRHQNELILNAAGDGIYGVDLQGNITFINIAGAKILGYQVSELIGQNIHFLIHHTKADGSFYPPEECPLYKTLKEGSIYQIDDEVFWRKNGLKFPVEYVCTPITENNIIVGAVITFKDITERRAIEQLKDDFIAVVSHELRTPLTSIRTSLGLLTSGLLNNQPTKAQWMLEVAMESTNRLVRLVNDILDIERMKSGKVKMNKEICDAENLLKKAANLMLSMAEKSHINLSINSQSITIYADSDRIIQTLTNLISNAIKFSPENSTIWLKVSQENEYILFQVKDEGRGIPADKIETIFGRFQQVDASDSRKQGGTGLGLAICQSIIQQHEGLIWAESILGKGSTFYFTLPLKNN